MPSPPRIVRETRQPNSLSGSRRVQGTANGAVSTDSPEATDPYRLTISMRDPPHHAVVLSLHDKPPTPSEGGGGWEEVSMPRRPSVLIWKGRGLMKMTMSVVIDEMLADQSVYGDAYTKLVRLWRPEGSSNPAHDDTSEPPVLKLAAKGDVVPYKNLAWVLGQLEWGEATGNDDGARTQQILVLTFTEFRADVRLQPGGSKTRTRTQPYKVKAGEKLAQIARRYGITAKELGALQKPPIKDSRNVEGKTIVVPIGKPKHGKS